MDGEITIGTSLSTDKFDRQIKKLEEKMADEEKKKIKIDADVSDMQQKIADFEKAEQEAKQYGETIKQLQAERKKLYAEQPELIVGQSPQIDTINAKIDETIDKRKQAYDILTKEAPVIDKLRSSLAEQEEKQTSINNKIQEYKQQIESVKLQQHVAEVNRMKDSFDNVGSSIRNAIGHVGRLALGIFGIRSAYLGVRQAISTLSQYNSTLANQIQAIKLALITAIEPIINFIVGVVSKVVSFIGYILKMLFGIDIFARATALSFGKINAGASGASKSVKEIRKQLAGFDEANVLNENGTTGGVGGVGGALDGVQDMAKNLKDLNAEGKKVFKNFKKWLLGSDKKTIKGIWQDNLKIIKDFLKDTKKAFEPLGEWIDKNAWQPIKQLFQETMRDLAPVINPIKSQFKEATKIIKDYWRDLVNNQLKPLWKGFTDYMKPNVVDPIVKTFEPIGVKIYNSLVPYANNIIDLINKTFGAFGINLKKWEYKTEESTQKVDEQFSDTMKSMEKSSNTKGKEIEKDINNPLGNIKDKIKDVAKQTLNINTNTSKLDTLKTKLKNIWETLKDIVTGKWEFTLRASGGGGTGSFGGGSGGGGYRAHGGIYYPSKLPKLASGGIINVPGRGVPYNGAIIGERGAEAVVPLTDNQQMELLGATIGKYITINANVINTMNGRVISRELKQIKNEQDFAFNQ